MFPVVGFVQLVFKLQLFQGWMLLKHPNFGFVGIKPPPPNQLSI